MIRGTCTARASVLQFVKLTKADNDGRNVTISFWLPALLAAGTDISFIITSAVLAAEHYAMAKNTTTLSS